ncbi:MAG: hypothetical protein IKA68_01965 [Clostridia bacterium]|nr:hypothetical protein [Clostridia bacterium]
MKLKLSCLLLSALMIVFCFAGCAEKDKADVMNKIGMEASEGAVTLSMYLMSEAPVSDEQELAMEAAVNAITEKEFKVHLDLKYFTADKYYETLEADLKKMTEYYSGDGIGKKEDTPVYTDENGLPVTYYPPIEEFDVDIFYFGGYDKYVKYSEAGYLKDISTEVDGSAKALKAVINTNLLNQVKALNGKYDMIPTNRAIGEYTYLLLNKKVLQETQYAASDITSLVDEDCQDLLSLVDDIFGDEYVPLKSYTGELDLIDVEYFGVDANGMMTDDFSLIAGTYNNSWVYGAAGSYPEMSHILNTKDSGRLSAQEQIKVLKGYEFNGYLGDEADADKPFAVGYIKGGAEVVEKYGDDYEIVPVQMPKLETADVYEHVMAISEKTNSVQQSAEVLTHLNTNEEFRNLLLYGIEKENYIWVDAIGEDGNPIIDENGDVYKVVSRLTDDPEKLYVMDKNKTGNVIYAYPEAGENPLASEYALEQNQDLQLDYTLGFNLYNASFAKLGKVDLTALKAVTAASAGYYQKIVDAKTEDELNAVLDEIKAYVEGDDVKAVLDMPGMEEEAPEADAPAEDGAEGGEDTPVEEEKDYTSVAAYYDEWLTAKALKVVETEEAE